MPDGTAEEVTEKNSENRDCICNRFFGIDDYLKPCQDHRMVFKCFSDCSRGCFGLGICLPSQPLFPFLREKAFQSHSILYVETNPFFDLHGSVVAFDRCSFDAANSSEIH